jgi:prolipoprotein diacylglyceryltransferase
LALCGLLILLDRKRSLRPGNILPIYVGLYFAGRLWIESLRIDEASMIGPFRINIWMSIIGIGGAVIVLLVRGLRRTIDDIDEPYLDGHVWTPPTDTAKEEKTDESV